MCAADEVIFVDAVYGAYFNACSAAGAKRIIDYSKIVFNLYSLGGACLFTLHTADTSVRAILARQCALVMIGAFDDYAGRIVDQLDDVVGAGANADAATDALDGGNARNAVFNADSIVGAFVGAVAVSEAGECAAFISLVEKVCGSAGFCASVNVFVLNDIACSAAGNVCNLFDNGIRLNAEYACDRASGGIAAGGAKIGLIDLFFSQSLGVTVAAGESASSAVCSGEAIADGGGGFIGFRAEEDACQCEKDSASKSDSR